MVNLTIKKNKRRYKMTNITINNNYKSGVCNIGTQEKKLRRRTGYFGLVGTLIGFLAIIAFDLPQIFSLILIFPIYMSVIGFYQDKSNFCVYFGFNGIYNMEEKGRKVIDIQNEIQKKADRKKAFKMSFIASTLSIVITGVLYFAIAFI
jgi:hypothetical protein